MTPPSKIHLALAFKDFSYWVGYSSVGLNVAAITSAQELNFCGIPTEVFGVRHNVDLFHKIRDAQASDNPLTHVVIMAPWITPRDLEALAKYFPNVQFTVQSHCNVGALHGDYRGLGNLRNYMDLAFSYPNISIAGNSARFVEWARHAYDTPIFLLPNLYPLEKKFVRVDAIKPPINIGIFGAIRLEKNFITAVAAALAIQRYLNISVNIHVNVGGETGTKGITETIQQMTDGIPGVTLIKHRWMAWDKFCELIHKMDILLQPSFTESFNMVTADGIVNGVPSVVSTAIVWAPKEWKADSDDAMSIARRGIWLLEHLPTAIWHGYNALTEQNAIGICFWKEYLGINEVKKESVYNPECKEKSASWHERFWEWVGKIF